MCGNQAHKYIPLTDLSGVPHVTVDLDLGPKFLLALDESYHVPMKDLLPQPQ